MAYLGASIDQLIYCKHSFTFHLSASVVDIITAPLLFLRSLTSPPLIPLLLVLPLPLRTPLGCLDVKSVDSDREAEEATAEAELDEAVTALSQRFPPRFNEMQDGHLGICLHAHHYCGPGWDYKVDLPRWAQPPPPPQQQGGAT